VQIGYYYIEVNAMAINDNTHKKLKKQRTEQKNKDVTTNAKATKDDENDASELMDSDDSAEDEGRKQTDASDEESSTEAAVVVSDDAGEEEEYDNTETTKQLQKNRRKRARAVARTQGYRRLAKAGGYGITTASKDTVGTDTSRDVTSNILSLSEISRACKYAPQNPKFVAYSSLEEYEERLALANEPLPKGPRQVFRVTAEVHLRRAMNEAVLRTLEMGRTRVSAATMYSVLRPMVPQLRFSWAAPQGLIRHAQTTQSGAGENATPALNSFAVDQLEVEEERKIGHKQIEHYKSTVKAAALKQTKRAAAKKTKELGATNATLVKTVV
jgi:hypothetical protein